MSASSVGVSVGVCVVWGFLPFALGVLWQTDGGGGGRGVYPDLQRHVQVGVVGVRDALAHGALHCNRAEGRRWVQASPHQESEPQSHEVPSANQPLETPASRQSSRAPSVHKTYIRPNAAPRS